MAKPIIEYFIQSSNYKQYINYDDLKFEVNKLIA